MNIANGLLAATLLATAVPLHASTIDVPSVAAEAVATVDRFGAALAAGDFGVVEALLDPAVIVLESGGAERSREEYLGHHARSDAEFLAAARLQLMRRTARAAGNLAWVASESEIDASKDDKPLVLLSTETIVLQRQPGGWRIVHIHWSSRPRK